MRYAARARDGDLYLRQAQTEIRMDQLAKAFLLVDAAEIVASGAPSVGHDAVVCAYDAGKEPKSQDALPIVMFKTFIIDECDLFFDDGLEHLPVGGLLLFCVG